MRVFPGPGGSKTISPAVVLGLAAMLSGCGGATSGGSHVRIVARNSPMPGCEFLQQVSVSTGADASSPEAARTAATARLKARAAELGGTDVLTSAATPAGGSFTQAGDVYRCAGSPTR